MATGSFDAAACPLPSRPDTVLIQPMVVGSKGSAGDLMGTDIVAKSPVDGDMLVLVDVFEGRSQMDVRKML